MSKIIEKVLTDIFKGIIYSALLGVVGLGLSLLMGWPLLKGAYLLILIAGSLVMIIAILLLIGTSKSRMQYILRGKIKDGKIEKLDEAEKRRDFAASGVSPAIIASVMVIMGFILEALMH
jgi:hypothetical protein